MNEIKSPKTRLEQLAGVAGLVQRVDLLAVCFEVMPQDIFHVGGYGHAVGADPAHHAQNLALRVAADVHGRTILNVSFFEIQILIRRNIIRGSWIFRFCGSDLVMKRRG